MRSIHGILTVTLAVCLAMAGAAEAAKRYEIKSGYIKYKTSQGSEELYWDNYGEQEARYTDSTVTVFGMTQSSATVNILDGKWAYNFDRGSKTATKMDYEQMMSAMTGDSKQQPRDFSEKMIKAFDGEKIGTESILGKKATTYKLNKFGDYRVSVYKGVPLKASMNMMGFTFDTEAVEFKENARVDQAKLRLPQGIQIVEADPDEIPSAEEMQQARDMMDQYRNSPEMQDAMRQMKAMQDDPEMQKAMKQMHEYQNSEEYKDVMQKSQQTRQAQGGSQGDGENLAEDVGDIIKEETNTAVKDSIRGATRDVIGGGLRSIFNN